MRLPNTRLAAVIEQAACSNSGLANRVVAVAADHGVELRCDHVSVKRWLDGTTPRGMTPHFVALALSRKLGRPVALEDIGMSDSAAGWFLTAARYPDTLRESLDAIEGLVTADARSGPAHELDPTVWSEVMLRWLIAPDDAPVGATEGSPVAAVEGVQRSMQLFSQLDYQFGGGYARGSLIAFVDGEFLPVVRAHGAKAPVRLLSAGAALLRLTGWTAYDVGDHGLSMRYLTQALRFAHAAGDRPLGGRILASMSHQATFLGHPAAAVNFARTAQRGAGGTATPTAMALFCAMEARAHAAARDREQCENALLAASNWFEQRKPEDDPAWLRYFDGAELAAEFAHSYRDLGMANRAIEYATVAVRDTDPLYARSILFCKSVQIAGHLGSDEVDEGLELATEVLDAASGLRSYRLRAYIRDIVDRFQRYHTEPAVQEFIDRATKWLAAAQIRSREGATAAAAARSRDRP